MQIEDLSSLTQQEKVDRMWRDHNWRECLDYAKKEMHGGIDARGNDTGTRTLQYYEPGAYEERAWQLMEMRGFKRGSA